MPVVAGYPRSQVDLQSYVLDPEVKTAAEGDAGQTWHTCMVRVFWECLAEALCPQDFEVPTSAVLHFIPREAEDTESQRTMSIHQVAGACHNDNPYTRLWQPEVKVTIKLKEVLWGTVGCTSAKGITLLSLQRNVYARVPNESIG